MPLDLVQSIARTHPQLRRVLERNYPSPSERDLALVRFAKLARWEPTAAWAWSAPSAPTARPTDPITPPALSPSLDIEK